MGWACLPMTDRHLWQLTVSESFLLDTADGQRGGGEGAQTSFMLSEYET